MNHIIYPNVQGFKKKMETFAKYLFLKVYSNNIIVLKKLQNTVS